MARMLETDSMQIRGACHCGNIRYVLTWPEAGRDIPVRECGCSFCRKHGGAWTSNRNAELSAVVEDESQISKYQFGTATAEFYTCSRCGVVPFVISHIEKRRYAVVNVNTFEGVDTSSLVRTATDFDGEGAPDRLERRKRNWIPHVQISGTSA